MFQNIKQEHEDVEMGWMVAELYIVYVQVTIGLSSDILRSLVVFIRRNICPCHCLVG